MTNINILWVVKVMVLTVCKAAMEIPCSWNNISWSLNNLNFLHELLQWRDITEKSNDSEGDSRVFSFSFVLAPAWKRQILNHTIFFFFYLSKFPFNASLKKPHEHNLLKLASSLPTGPCHGLYFSTLSFRFVFVNKKWIKVR